MSDSKVLTDARDCARNDGAISGAGGVRSVMAGTQHLREHESTESVVLSSCRYASPAGRVHGRAVGMHLDMYFGPLFKYRVERQPDAARTRLLTVRLGYLFGKTAPDSADPFVEHTPIIEVTPRFYLVKNILLTDRNRYDFRFVNGVYTPRYRNRVKLERTFQIGKRALTPYAYVEGFYDRRYDGFHRFRYTAGAEFQINQRFVLEGYYLRQQDFESRASRAQCCGDRITSLFPLKGTRS